MVNSQATKTHYDVLSVQPSASQAEIKAAYHRILLTSHPDKQRNLTTSEPGLEDMFDLDRIRDAYRTLSDPDARLEYNATLKRNLYGLSIFRTGPRPAQVVSLEDFEVSYPSEGEQTDAVWSYACRCGSNYSISEADLENDRHLITCERCSETIYVGYEAIEENEEEHIKRDG